MKPEDRATMQARFVVFSDGLAVDDELEPGPGCDADAVFVDVCPAPPAGVVVF